MKESLVVPIDGLGHRTDEFLSALTILALATRRVRERDVGAGGKFFN